jgi:hypothetical protein
MPRKEISKKDTASTINSLQVLAPNFLDSLYSDIDSLSYFEGIHPLVFGYHRLLSKRFPFAVYYKIFEDEVLVMAVLDCRRNPSWIREKLMNV